MEDGMMLDRMACLYDRVCGWWRRPPVSRRLYAFLVFFFVCSVPLLWLNKAGMLPAGLAAVLPTNQFYAIQLAFTLILALEVVELILAVAESVTLAVSKQLEIMSLIMLRDAFTDFSLLHHPMQAAEDKQILLQMAAVAVSGLLLFIFRALFMKMRYLQRYSSALPYYIRAKKCIALMLLFVIAIVGLADLYGFLFLGNRSMFFETFYTLLIFTDILLLLTGQYYLPSFHVTFRNSGYAVGTLLMRIALSAPQLVGAGLCVMAGLYVLALAWATSRFAPPDTKAE